MKNILLILALTTAFVFTSCEGDPGPVGPQGEPGINILGQVFEIDPTFQYNDYPDNTYSSEVFSYPFEVFESDVVLVYRYEGQVNIGNGNTSDLWTQLPQSVFFQDGTGDIYQYNFNHTFVDIQITIEGNFDLTNIGNDPISNQIFRIAVVPAEFAQTNPTMEELMSNPEVNFIEPSL